MTRDEHLMVIAMEECNEIAQRLSKALRFGQDERQPGQDQSNRQRILFEYIDLVAVMQMLGFRPIGEAQRELLIPKQAKVEHFLAYSAECGTLTPDPKEP